MGLGMGESGMDPWLASHYGGVSPEDASGRYKWRGASRRPDPDDQPPPLSRGQRRRAEAALSDAERLARHWSRWHRPRRVGQGVVNVLWLVALVLLVLVVGVATGHLFG